MNTTHAQCCEMVKAEVYRAVAKHGDDSWGRHEFYAILLEEVDELWDDIKKNAPQDQLEREAVQVAAVIFRYLQSYETKNVHN